MTPSRRTTSRAFALASALALVAGACSGSEPEDSSRSDDTVAPADEPAGDSVADSVVVESTDEPTDDAGDAVDPPVGGEGWTVLLYSIADTDLEPYLLVDVGEMAEVGSSENLNLVALVDRAADYSAEPLLNIPDWQGAKLFEVEQGAMTEQEDLGDLNTGDPNVLASFIARGIADHPAAHYSLIISDHGASWPGVGGDESSGHDGLSLAELRDGIGAGLEAAGVEKLDLLGFDACLMATYEVATTLAPLADRMLASQELEPGHGWDYRTLQVLADDPAATADTLGTALVEGFEAQARESGTDAEITLSLIDLNQMGAVDEALSTFTGQLVDAAAQVAPVVGRTRAATLGFGRNPDPTEDTQMTDLGLLASQIGIDALYVSDAADGLVRSINDAVVTSVAGSGMRGATGLSIYFPPTPELLSADYAGVTDNGGWYDFLAAYYGAGDAIAPEEEPQFLNEFGVAETFFDEDGLTIAGTFDLAAADNLSEATISYGTVDENGAITFFGEEPAFVADDGSGTASGFYDLTTLTITDGIDTARAYLTLSVDDEAGTWSIDVPMAYYSPDDVGGETYQDVLLTLTIDTETGDIVNETYYAYDDELGTYGELTADPEGIIVPEVPVVGADGTVEWVPTSDVGLYADLPSLEYDLTPLDSGTALYVELSVTDFGGNYDSVFAEVVVP